MQPHRSRVIAAIGMIGLAEWFGQATVQASSRPAVPAVDPTYAHVVSLSNVPGSEGNGTLFAGLVCRIGLDHVQGCFPGYANGVSQIAFRTYALPPGNPRLSYRFRSDTQFDSDFTRVVLDDSGLSPILLGTGEYVFASAPSQRHTLVTYDGSVEGSAVIDLSAYAGTTVCIVFHSESDFAGSDGDCVFDTVDGFFEFDSVRADTSLTTFDSGPQGWTFGPLGAAATAPATRPLVDAALLVAMLTVAVAVLRRRSAADRIG
jgi:hypothetical protein